MIAKKSKKRLFGLVSTALAASILMQWLIIPKIQWNNGVLADGAWNPNNQDSASSVNYAKILGGALDYGIVANEINQQGHMETTFATNNFINSAGANNDIDFLDYDKTAHFIIANWQDDIVFGNTTAANFYIEGPSSLFDDFDPTSDDRENGNFYLDSNFFSFRNNIPVGQDFPPIPESPMPTPAIIEHVTSNLDDGTNANVNRLINRISEETDGWSDRLHSRATSAAYNLPSSYISNPTSNSILIDITDPIFDNRVVYVNVTSEMMQNIFRGGAVDAEGNPTQGLVIKKNASSVIVFNIEDDVCGDAALTTANFIVLSGNNRMGSTTNTNGNRTPYREGGSNVGSHVIDTELCRTVVWNIRTDNDVNLDSLAGTILIPQPVNVTISSGNCAGWLVTSGTVNVEKEFHYIYAGNSSDGHNQMHFASYKAFTTQYADKDGVRQYEVTNIDINSGDYRFNWAEYTDGTWSSVVDGTACTISADTTGDIEFPVQTFYTDDAHIGDPHYVAPEGSEDFYYRVTEIPGTVPGVSYSNGFINIRLKVESDADGNLSYFVQSYTQNGDGSYYSSNGTWDDDSDWAPMAGVRFDLGGFYNKVDTSSLVITKTVGGDYNTVVDDTFSFYVYSVDTSGARTYYKENGESNGSTAYPIDVTFTVAGAVRASALITGLPDGEYFVEEVGSSAERTGYVLDSGSHSTSVIVSSDTFSQANITNTYSKLYNLEVTKTVTGSGAASISSDDFSFYIKTQSGDQYVQENGELGSQPHYFSVAAGETVRLSDVPAGQYVVVEDLDNAEAHATGTVVFDEDSSTTNPSIEVYTDSTAIAELINNYIDNSVGTLTISKTTVGATYVDTNPSNAFEFRVSYVDNGTTYYVHLDNGVYVADQWNPYATLTVMPGSSINITGDFVVVGRVFHVEELNYDTKTESWRFVDGLPHTYSTTAINGTECTATDVEIISGNNSLCDVVNYFDGTAPAEGSIEINKTISLDSRVSLTDIGTITFEVRNGSTVVETINLDPNNLGTGWTKNGDVYSYTVTGLNVGTEYTVTETVTGAQGSVVLASTSTTTATATASDATTLPASAKAALTNNYERQGTTTGVLVIRKTISGAELNALEQISFSITGPDQLSVPNLCMANVGVGADQWHLAGTGIYEYTFSSVSVGTYSVIEGMDGHTTTYTLDVDNSTTSGSAPVSVGGTAVIELTDAYTQSTTPTDPTEPTTPTEPTEPTGSDDSVTPVVPGSLIISKTISGTSLNELETITFVLTDTTCGATREVPALTIENVNNGIWQDAGNGTYYYVVDNLTPGVTYSVVESLDGHTSVYTLDVANSVTIGTAMVVSGGTVTVSLTDAYTTTGGDETTPETDTPDETTPSDETEETAPEVVSVTLDGQPLEPGSYTVNPDGSVTINQAIRRSLSSGSHTIVVTYVNGASRTQTLMIDEADRSIGSTGEASVNAVSAVIMLSALVMIYFARKLREDEQDQ